MTNPSEIDDVKFKSNYFQVTNEQEYHDLFQNLYSKTGVKDLTIKNNDGIFHVFGSDSSVEFIIERGKEETYFSIEEFLRRLWFILNENQSFVFVDNEKWISVSYTSMTITRTLPSEETIQF